ncbi:Transcription factor Abd-B, contains HOX domain [Handroanthus impetiginosus]|uniref:Transcription factor Abd-B, contains HOX domain n=1 Tax=Handroanthus impetiginosus TaxID=429701 RepID=A0A2G9GQX5_9LAMI|nr:Transcription factor Abd-B, contains HOX domain [Handroanthus impetiginosus]
MHGQGNYTSQVGQGPYAPPAAFQQRPAAPHSTSLHGPPAPQPQVIQQGHPSFHPTPGIFAYQHAAPGVPPQGPPASMSSSQSYLSHPHPPQVHVSTSISHSYPNSEQQRPPWGQNVRQLPSTASHPGPIGYPLPSSQRNTLGRGQFYQPTPHSLPGPPPPPLYSSTSSFLTSDPFGSSSLSMRHHSYPQQAGPLPPPPLPPPPPSSRPEIPPLPPSLPPSDFLSKNDGSRSSKDLLDGANLMLGHPYPAKPVDDGSAHQIEVPGQLVETNVPKVASVDALAAISPADSDMDMEDDITHPEEEKKHSVHNNLKDECIPISQEGNMEEPQSLRHAGGHKSPIVVRHGNPLSPEALVSKDQRGGSELVSDSDFLVTRKVSSGTDDSGMTESGQIEHPLDATVKQSSFEHKNFREPSVPETGCGKLSGQQMEGANPFKLLQGYASDNTSEHEGEHLLGDVSRPSINDGSTNFDAEMGCNLVSKPDMKSSSANDKVEEFFDKTPGGQESVSVDTSLAHQPKDSSGNHDANIGIGGANFHKPDMKSNSTKLNVDEFGRLVREGVSDSETSDSSHYTRRHSRRARKRSRSQSRSRSPHDRRRRWSPWRRKERHGRSRSSSPKRRRSRSRSPLLRRQSGYSGDKLRREKGQLQECFDFLRGKCYRGATCRYSHHESGKSERLRYNRGKQQYRDTSPALRGPDYHESKFLPDKEVKDMGLILPQGMPDLREGKDAKERPVDSTTHSPDKLNSLKSGSRLVADGVASSNSGYCAHVTSRKESSFFSESPAKDSDKIPQSFDQQSKRMDVQAKEATSAHLPAEKPDATQGPTIQMSSVGSPTTKPYSTGAPSQSVEQLPPSTGDHPSQLAPPFPSVNNAPFAQPRNQDYNLMPPTAQFHSTPDNYSPYQAPVAYQHSHFPGPSNSLSSSFVPPPAPPYSHLSMNVTTGERSIPSQHMRQLLLPPRDGVPSYASMRVQPAELSNQSLTGQNQSYPLAQESDQMVHINDSFGSSSLHASNLMSRRGDPRIMREDRLGQLVQGMHPVQSFAQAQPNSAMQSLPKERHGSLGGGLPSDSTSTHGHPCFQQASHGPQHSGACGLSAELDEPGSSSMSRITPDFPEKNHPYLRDFVESTISNHFNPYASTFDLPLSSKFSSNALIQENDKTIHPKYGTPVGLSSVSVDAEKNGGIGSRKSLHPGLPAESESVVPRPGGDQYDPLFDSIEPASNSFSKADHEKHETTGDSDNMMKFRGSGRALDTKHEGAAASTNNSLENEEYGETADAEVGAVLNASPSNPDDATDMNAGEIEIDQVKASGKKKKSKDSRSMKLFKVSIATFVKEVLKPSWRQGNMSKEAFKTIVKKTVDKVSGAMKGHHVPKSQAKINHYIDSSRGKLTKLVMGYVDKYVKV